MKGAFTGAYRDVTGYFETARGGTLFLDEIGSMPHEVQVLLLRVLQEKVYTPVGDRKEYETDVRILSATNEDMERAMREGRFREDLYHRLATFEVRQPSLAECPEDILPLADFSADSIPKRYAWKPPDLPRRLKQPCSLIPGPAMYVNSETVSDVPFFWRKPRY